MSNNNKIITVLSGAGISAESGIQTFRGIDGLWEGHRVEDVASPEGWSKNPELVLNFYNERRRKLATVSPNTGHTKVAELESKYKVYVVTQNVDDLHERAGSTDVLHIHGRLLSMKSSENDELVYPCKGDILMGDLAEDGSQLRPDIVWFGENVTLIGEAIDKIKLSETVIVIGTSLQVYPAASLIGYAHRCKKLYYIDPAPKLNYELNYMKDILTVIKSNGSEGMTQVYEELMK